MKKEKILIPFTNEQIYSFLVGNLDEDTYLKAVANEWEATFNELTIEQYTKNGIPYCFVSLEYIDYSGNTQEYVLTIKRLTDNKYFEVYVDRWGTEPDEFKCVDIFEENFFLGNEISSKVREKAELISKLEDLGYIVQLFDKTPVEHYFKSNKFEYTADDVSNVLAELRAAIKEYEKKVGDNGRKFTSEDIEKITTKYAIKKESERLDDLYGTIQNYSEEKGIFLLIDGYFDDVKLTKDRMDLVLKLRKAIKSFKCEKYILDVTYCEEHAYHFISVMNITDELEMSNFSDLDDIEFFYELGSDLSEHLKKLWINFG